MKNKMKLLVVAFSLTCIAGLVSVEASISETEAHPFPIETSLKTAKLNGYLTASNKYFTATFNINSIEGIFYSKENRMTVLSFSGSVMLGNSRTNILIDDTVMKYDEVLALIEAEHQKIKN